MGKKRKGKSVRNNKNTHQEPEELIQAPHSFVIHKGLSGGNTLDLTKDFRKVMEPYTATALKERKKNTIKDFVSIAGPLHVSHLSIFSRTEVGMYLKIARLARGPTMTFKIHTYSLARDVVSSLKKQAVTAEAFKHSPLIILNSFSGEGLHLKMMATMFQNMFPTINLTSVDLNSVRRCVLLNYNPTTKLIDFRHYTIKVIPVGISKGVKKVVQGKIPNLAKCNDISEFLTKSGMLSESEAEDDPSNHVLLSQKLKSRGNNEAGKSAIKLSELGPRLTLQLIKIEDGLLDGAVLYHDLIEKTEEEKIEIQKKREAKKKLKEKRKKIQESNTKTKERGKEEHKEKSLKGMKKDEEQQSQGGKNVAEMDEEKEIVDDDAEYYRQEVGEEPDKDLFTSTQSYSSRPKTPHFAKNRKRKMDDKPDKQIDNKRFKRDNKSKPRGKTPKGKPIDKTNSSNRDQRPIGGGKSGRNKPKFTANKKNHTGKGKKGRR